MDVLLIHLAGPAMSFGGPRIDELGTTSLFPSRAWVTGLLANALGYDRQEIGRLTSLQERLRIASRCDRAGQIERDYQIADPSNVPGYRETMGATAAGKKNIRYRDYWADAAILVAATLDPGDGPIAQDLLLALRAPARPLFLGRKGFLPSTHLGHGIVQADTLDGALTVAPRLPRAAGGPLPARWPTMPGSRPGTPQIVPGDDRDWANGLGVGRSVYVTGTLTPAEAHHE